MSSLGFLILLFFAIVIGIAAGIYIGRGNMQIMDDREREERLRRETDEPR